MNNNFETYVTVSADDGIIPADISVYPSVQIKYKINAEGKLLRAKNTFIPKNSIIGIKSESGLKSCDTELLSRGILNETANKAISGVFLNIEPVPENIPKTEELCRNLETHGIKVFLPYLFGNLSDKAKLIAPASVSGGSLKDVIISLSNRFSPERICLKINKDCFDYLMPSYEPSGKSLTTEETEELISRHNTDTYFSEKMGCKYFTYRDEGKTHFVLFDDIDTAVYKLNLAKSLDLYCAYLSYDKWGEEIKDIINQIK